MTQYEIFALIISVASLVVDVFHLVHDLMNKK